MFKAIKETYGKVAERYRRMQAHRLQKRKTELADEIIDKVSKLKDMELDEVDVNELQDALDIIDMLHTEKAIEL